LQAYEISGILLRFGFTDILVIKEHSFPQICGEFVLAGRDDFSLEISEIDKVTK